MIYNVTTKVPDAFDSPVEGWRGWNFFLVPIFLGGVALPVIAMGTELVSHMCGEVFFNPLPTFLHVILVALIPIANLWLMLSLRQGKPRRRVRLLAFLNGAAIGVSAFYSILFIPILPIGAVAVVIYGMGLLILAPPLALAASMGLRRRFSRIALEKPRGLWAGCACALALLVIIEIPSTVTRLGMEMAASEDAAARIRGVRLLRVLGDKGMMLRLCYAWPTRATDLTGFLISQGRPVGTEKARSIYYQVQGVTFNSLPAPERASSGWFDFRSFDAEQGGSSVAGMVPGLSLSASRIDASIDAQAALAYQEWSLDFENQGTAAAEARAQIELPPEGVVSRLTLWVDGEEREAAFAARGAVRAAYESVVRARRDPVLVTTQGRDRVLMQCFPVPSGGGRMKVRLGITSPLAFSSTGEAHFHAPRFAERNFGVFAEEEGEGGGEKGAKTEKAESADSEKGVHSIWLESTEPFPSTGEDWTQGNEGDTHTLRGRRSESWLAGGRSWVVGGSSGNHVAWAEDSSRLGKSIIRQWPETSVRAPLGDVTLVVDGSRGMRPYLEGISGAIRRAGRPVRIVLAGSDEVREFKGAAQEAGNWLERQPCVGGQDNVTALMRAWDAASKDRQGAILWIAAAQPVLLSPAGSFRQRLERGGDRPRFLALQVGNGPNRLLEELEGLPLSALRGSALRVSGPLQVELESLLSSSPVTRTVLVREKRDPGVLPVGGSVGGTSGGKKTSSHLARIFAHEEIGRLIAGGGEPAREKAVAMASAFQLVTPVSGAVVLENAGQYAAAGLEPAGAATVPGIPEPEMVWLALVVAAVLLARARPLRFLKLGRRTV